MAITFTPLSCGECADGEYRHSDTDNAMICKSCGYVVHHTDVARYLDANERIGSRHNGTSTPDAVIVRTDACECCGTVNDHHFDVATADGIIPCPNDEN